MMFDGQRFSSGTVACLNGLMGHAPAQEYQGVIMGPRLVALDDPADDAVELVARAMEEDRAIRRANRRVSRMQPGTAGRLPTGEMTLDGRACCWRFAQRVLSAGPRIELGSTHVCPDCGAQWRLEMGIAQ